MPWLAGESLTPPAAHVVAVILSPSRGCGDSQGLSWSCLHRCVCRQGVCRCAYKCLRVYMSICVHEQLMWVECSASVQRWRIRTMCVCVRGPDCRHNWIDSSHCEGCRRVNWCVFLESSPDALSSFHLLLLHPVLHYPPPPPPSAVILIRRERPAKELQLVVAGHLPPVEAEIRRHMRDFKYSYKYL